MDRWIFGRYERGQALPLIAVCFVVIFGFAALAVDVGAAQYRQRMQQTATDAAARRALPATLSSVRLPHLPLRP